MIKANTIAQYKILKYLYERFDFSDESGLKLEFNGALAVRVIEDKHYIEFCYNNYEESLKRDGNIIESNVLEVEDQSLPFEETISCFK